MRSALSWAILLNNIMTTFVGLSANSLVIYLCYKVRQATLKETKIFIASHAVADFILTLVYTALQIGIVVGKNTIYFVIMEPLSSFPVEISRVLFAIFCFIFVMNVLTLSMGFAHRCAIICGKRSLKWIFTRRCFPFLAISLIAIDIIFCTMLVSNLNFSFVQLPAHGRSDFGEPIRVAIKDNFTELEFAICVLWIPMYCLNRFLCYHCRMCSNNFEDTLICEVLHSSSRYAIPNHYRHDTASKLSFHINRHMQCCFIMNNRIFQAVLPIIFSTLPMIFVIGLIVSPFDVHIGSYGSLIVAVLYWEPCVYPLLSLYFVRPLRDSIWGQKCLFKSTPVATSNFALGTIRK
ncbi:unnamed protein product [Toxocara canis]|uniref:G_PROTEIN_RECEP_F1_2 domain-containing protein n=1 Tax=Toxocara canis TaxID=6265 RepID=A0A183TZC6_TOXCA|nr:unnamed protein product [Toxocara canis]